MEIDWPFDQGENVAALTTRQVLRHGQPILRVIHYSDDHSWAFTCGTTSDPNDALIISMKRIVEHDPTLLSIADLLPVGTLTVKPLVRVGSDTSRISPRDCLGGNCARENSGSGSLYCGAGRVHRADAQWAPAAFEVCWNARR